MGGRKGKQKIQTLAISFETSQFHKYNFPLFFAIFFKRYFEKKKDLKLLSQIMLTSYFLCNCELHVVYLSVGSVIGMLEGDPGLNLEAPWYLVM